MAWVVQDDGEVWRFNSSLGSWTLVEGTANDIGGDGSVWIAHTWTLAQ